LRNRSTVSTDPEIGLDHRHAGSGGVGDQHGAEVEYTDSAGAVTERAVEPMGPLWGPRGYMSKTMGSVGLQQHSSTSPGGGGTRGWLT
jgi:hypothetical protein